MAYSTLGRDSAHCKHRASKALKPKQQIRRAPAVQVIPHFRKKTSRDLRISLFLSRHSIFPLLSYRPVFLSVTPASEPESRSILLPYPPGFRVKPGMTGERSVVAYSTLGRDSAHCKHRASKALKPKQQIRAHLPCRRCPRLSNCQTNLSAVFFSTFRNDFFHQVLNFLFAESLIGRLERNRQGY